MSGLSRFIGLLLLPIYTRIFSVEDYGVIDIFSVFTNLIIVTATLRLSTSISRYYSEKDRGFNTKQLCSSILFFVIFINTFVFLLLWLFSSKISFFITGKLNLEHLVLLSSISACFTSISKIPMMILRRKRKIIIFSTIQTISSIIYAFSSLSLIFIYDYGINSIFLGMIISNIFILFCSLYAVRDELGLNLNKIAIKTALKYSLPLVPGKYFMWLNAQLNRIMLLSLIGLSGVGLFAIGSRVASILQLFLTIFQRAWNPFSIEIINQKGSDFIYKKALTYYLGITFISGIILSISSPAILYLLTSQEFYSGRYVVPWIIGTFIINGSSRIINIGTVINEQMSYNSKGEFIAFIANLVISYFLILFLGFKGAAIGMFLAQIISKLYIWNATQKISDIKFENKKIYILVLVYLICSISINSQTIIFGDSIYRNTIPFIICFIGIIFMYKISIDSLLKNQFKIIFKVYFKKGKKAIFK